MKRGRKQKGHGPGRSDAGQHPDQGSDQHAYAAKKEIGGLKGDLKAVKDVMQRVHIVFL